MLYIYLTQVVFFFLLQIHGMLNLTETVYDTYESIIQMERKNAQRLQFHCLRAFACTKFLQTRVLFAFCFVSIAWGALICTFSFNLNEIKHR